MILMVDTGSLEGLGEIIDGSMNFGIINNVSTILALHIVKDAGRREDAGYPGDGMQGESMQV